MNHVRCMGIALGMACCAILMLTPTGSYGQVVVDLTSLSPGSCPGAVDITVGGVTVSKTVQAITNGCKVLIAGKYNIDNLPTGDSSGNDIEIFNINGTAAVEFTEVNDGTPSVGTSDSHKHQIVLKSARIRNAITTRASLNALVPITDIVSSDLIEFRRLGAILDEQDRKGNHIYGGAWRATDDLGRTSTSSAEGFLCNGTGCVGFTAIPFPSPSPLAGNLSGTRRLTASFSGNNLNVPFENLPITATPNKAFVLGMVSVIGLKPPVRSQTSPFTIINDEYLDASVTVNLDNSGASIGGGGGAPCDETGETDSSGELVCVQLWQGLTFMEPGAAVSALQAEHCPANYESKCAKQNQ